jgi:sulfite reductase (NADPH) flavoprotein alpha-component
MAGQESPVFWYFGYGSNMDLKSLRAKGVEPRISQRAVLHGWRLRFNVQHFFRHEGGVGNIEASGDPSNVVWGVLHLCEDEHLALLDAAEACGHGYDRIEVTVGHEAGEQRAIAYAGLPAFINNTCLPTRRYLNILLQGATAAGLDGAYVEALRKHPVQPRSAAPPFVPPPGDYPSFNAAALARQPLLTALAGCVFDMADARSQHRFLQGFFGGKDMTLFHLKRLDHSDGSETLEDLRCDRLTPAQRQYLDEYLHAYMEEYAYAGRFLYD